MTLVAARALLGRVPWQAWALLLVAGAVWWHGHSRYQAGAAAERAIWERVIADANAAADRQRRDEEEATRQFNTEVRIRYESEIARIAADRDSLARRLRNASVPATFPAAERAGGSAAAAASPEPGGQERAAAIDAALDVYDRACQADAARLNALIEQIRPQLSP